MAVCRHVLIVHEESRHALDVGPMGAAYKDLLASPPGRMLTIALGIAR
ncbi:MAG TPA: hypothetical protein VIM49_10455 [Dermatophilaceae bacterium]